MPYIIQQFVGSGRWVPYSERVSLRGPDFVIQEYASRDKARARCQELNHRHSTRETGDLYRVTLLQNPDTRPPGYKWVGDGAPAVETLAKARSALEKRLATLNERRAKLVEEINATIGYTEVTCLPSSYGPGCGLKMPIRELIYIQSHWYVRPSGCSDGDYWNEGEGYFDCIHCGRRNRLYERKEIEALRSHFRGVTELYEH